MIRIGFDKISRAIFAEDGTLLSIKVRDKEWTFVDSGPGVSLAVLHEGLRKSLLPVIRNESGGVASRGNEVVCTFDAALMEDGSLWDLRTVVHWRVEHDLLQAAVMIEVIPPPLILDAVCIPDVTVPYEEDVTIVLPRDSGLILKSAEKALFEGPDAPGEYAGLHPHMQFVGWEEKGAGLYLDCRDTDGWIKTWSFLGAGEKRVRILTEHKAPRPQQPLHAFELPYPVSLSAYRGNWYDCAAIYRRWASSRTWASRESCRRRGNYVEAAACWLWNRGPADHVVPPVNELSRRIGHPVILDWYWWHRHPYDTGYPEYFPPREGEERFRRAVEELHEQGNYVQVYTNGMSWDEELPSWAEQGKSCTVLQEDGTYWGVVYNTWMNHRLMHTCGASPLWHRVVLENVKKGRDLGLDGMYIDQIATAGGIRPCFSTAHGHVPGGGAYGIQGFRTLLANIRNRYPDLVITSEATRENFHDLLDADIILSTSLERMPWDISKSCAVPVPICSAVHHGKIAFFGNYAIVDGIPPFDALWPQAMKPAAADERDWHSLCPDQFALETARTVSFGMQPTVANLTMEHLNQERFAGNIAFLVELCRLYHRNREWLLWGEMLRPGELACPQVEVNCLERFVFTFPDKALIRGYVHPAVLHSEWRSPGGTAKAFFFNYTRRDATVEYVPPAGYSAMMDSKGMKMETMRLRMSVPARSAAEVLLCRRADAGSLNRPEAGRRRE